MASSRLPGKPLLEIHGLPMIEHVRRRTMRCAGFAGVYVTTCDEEIADVVRRAGGEVIMTSATHVTATDRVAEAAGRVECTHVVNVQGDEILVRPADLSAMVEAIDRDPGAEAWNAIARVGSAAELADPAVVKCVVSRSNHVLVAVRDLSVWPLQPPGFEPARKILGILGYTRAFLERYAGLSRTPLETMLSVDQCRILEHDVRLRGVEFGASYPGINEPREVSEVLRVLETDVEQRAILADILKGTP
jgi:3-deoxy-manno-octulosonate cytidylyltransferase (CMP-KDO synthetase)